MNYNNFPIQNSKGYFLVTAITVIIIACRIGTLPVSPISLLTPTSHPVQPTITILPSISVDSAVTIPEIQFTEIPPNIEQEDSITITEPLSGAHITGTVMVRGMSDSTYENNLLIRLVDQNGDELLLSPTTIDSITIDRGTYAERINIPISDSRSAQLQVFDRSIYTGSLIHLSSVSVILDSDNSPSVDDNPTKEQIIIDSVTPTRIGNGTSFVITGRAVGIFENTLNYVVCGMKDGPTPDQLCFTKENRFIEGVVTITSNDVGLPGKFIITIADAFSLPPSATLVVYSISPMNGAIDHAESHLLVMD